MKRTLPFAALLAIVAFWPVLGAANGKPTLRPIGFIWQHYYEGPFAGPSGVSVDRATGQVLVADTGNSLIGLFTPTGIPLFTFGASDRVSAPARVVCFAGKVAVLDGDPGRVKAFNYRGEYLGALELPGIGEKPSIGTIATDAAGNLYVGENASGQVLVYATDLRLKLQFGTNGADDGQFQAITGIFATEKEIFVTDAMARPVQVFDRRGNFLRGWGKHELGNENFSLPQGIAVDSRGHVIVVDALRHEIKFFESDGMFLANFGGLGSAPGDLAFPSDVAVDESDRVFVSEKGNGRVQVFSLAKVPLPGQK
jgi:DNA-binding beta-propeller fold protein YncE